MELTEVRDLLWKTRKIIAKALLYMKGNVIISLKVVREGDWSMKDQASVACASAGSRRWERESKDVAMTKGMKRCGRYAVKLALLSRRRY
jgi:hypothetical protein